MGHLNFVFFSFVVPKNSSGVGFSFRLFQQRGERDRNVCGHKSVVNCVFFCVFCALFFPHFTVYDGRFGGGGSMLANALRPEFHGGLRIRSVIFRKVERQIFRSLRFTMVVLAVAVRCSRTLCGWNFVVNYASAV